MKTYLFVSKIRIQTALAYRFNVISTILVQCLIMYAMGDAVIPVPLAVITLAVGLLLFAGSCAVFCAGMGKYESTGS